MGNIDLFYKKFEELGISFNGKVIQYHNFIANVNEIKNDLFNRIEMIATGVYPLFGNKKEHEIHFIIDNDNLLIRMDIKINIF